MPESRSSDVSRASPADRSRDFSATYFGAGILAMAIGAGLFHPGAGLILAGLALTGIGFFGAPRKT